MSEDPDDLPVHPALAEPEADEPESENRPAARTPRQRAEAHRDTLEMYVDEGDLAGPSSLATIVAHGLLGVMAELRSIGNTLDRMRADLDSLSATANRMRKGR